ncbi:hypothetical protein V8C35DRAFT_129464 [Trichoderma chlorosporum]
MKFGCRRFILGSVTGQYTEHTRYIYDQGQRTIHWRLPLRGCRMAFGCDLLLGSSFYHV